jgi:hypothetical protein
MSGFRERLLALAATVLLAIALRWLSLPRVLRICDGWPTVNQPRHPPTALAQRVRLWLSRGRGPWRSTCLTRSLVLYAMLRQHGYRPRFVIGVVGGETSFDAHAWIALGEALIGDPSGATDRYTQLLTHGA